jgi:sugar/nucleoside kinase (ribokinase family)
MSDAPLIAVIGDSFVDVVAGIEGLPQWGKDIPCPRPIQLHPGGSALNTATQLANVNANVAFHSAIGTDAFGDLLSRHLAARGVHSHVRQIMSSTTGVCIVLSGQGDRAFVSHHGAAHLFSTDVRNMKRFSSIIDRLCPSHSISIA